MTLVEPARFDQLEGGCRYILDDACACDAARRGASAYCARHHALCHIKRGSKIEARAIRQIEACSTSIALHLNSKVLISGDLSSLGQML